jgi:hypothetical protein
VLSLETCGLLSLDLNRFIPVIRVRDDGAASRQDHAGHQQRGAVKVGHQGGSPLSSRMSASMLSIRRCSTDRCSRMSFTSSRVLPRHVDGAHVHADVVADARDGVLQPVDPFHDLLPGLRCLPDKCAARRVTFIAGVRLGPLEPFFDKTWQLADFELVN